MSHACIINHHAASIFPLVFSTLHYHTYVHLFDLNVFGLGQPKIMVEPRDVEVNFGGTAFFSCKVEGDPEPDIVWLQNK